MGGVEVIVEENALYVCLLLSDGRWIVYPFGRMVAKVCVDANANGHAWKTDYDSGVRAYSSFPCPLRKDCDVVSDDALETLVCVTPPSVASALARRISSGPSMQSYSANRWMESDGEMERSTWSSRSGDVACGCCQGAESVGRKLCWLDGRWYLRDGFAISNARCFGSYDAYSACASRGAGMASGCGGALAAALRRRDGGEGGCGGDGGDGDGCARPCRRQATPSNGGGGGPPSNVLDSSVACGRDSSFFRAMASVWIWQMGECRLRGPVWSPSRRVAPVTVRRVRCVRTGAPCLCLPRTVPLVSTDLYLGLDATQPCRRRYH